MKKAIVFFFLSVITICLSAQNTEIIRYALKKDISYIPDSEKDEYRKDRCKLDIYYPENKKNYSTVIWFHGGGLEGGEKKIPAELKEKGIAIVAVNYRLSPKAKNPAYIEDAAESVAWAFNNIEAYGGNPKNIFLSGHSAGGYLTLMVGLDKSYLEKYSINADSIRGLIPISGQTNTHYTIRKERGLRYPGTIPVIDEYAPINQARKNIPPTLLITGDKALEMTARYEENAHLYAVLEKLRNKDIELYELEGFNHANVYVPGYYLMLNWVRKYSRKQN